MQMATFQSALAARNVSKAFFGNPVLRGVSIELIPGRIHALLGENGAGKSTLINILSGALTPDAGELMLDGQARPALTPRAARHHGVAVVQQELSLSPSLSIAENIGLGAMPVGRALISYRTLAARAAEVLELVGLQAPLAAPVGSLPLGQRQLVEIAKALFRRPRVLILDEPTSSLSAHDVATLLALVRRLRAQGVAILYISHRLNEVLDLCDHVTVLKDGVCTADQPLAGVSPDGLVRLMVGRDPGDLFPPFLSSATGETVLDVANLCTGPVAGADLTLRRGEVLGLGGLVGQGQEAFLLGLYGAQLATARRASVLGLSRLPRSVPEANRCGLAYVPADRKKDGLLLPHSIGFNLKLPSFARNAAAWRRPAAEAGLVADLARRLGIKGDVRRPVQALSGGNQQKVALAKWLPRTPAVLLLNDPTRGVDVETKREIYLALRGMAAEGRSVVLLSSDTPELVHLCDRVAVFREGRIGAVLAHGAATEEAIVAAALGVG
ncbi:MAG TPA: sugar ABC transporter ATP-binding protein [Acetobacteraceae bacterium]|nr:sugar ABC transporter ATP-binding protein [Acetobacteraceae bacterium]